MSGVYSVRRQADKLGILSARYVRNAPCSEECEPYFDVPWVFAGNFIICREDDKRYWMCFCVMPISIFLPVGETQDGGIVVVLKRSTASYSRGRIWIIPGTPDLGHA
ncbi:MAG: hypothetical protein JWQ21_2291 [Herminiimonas sp.]|nr:hypothetical protein [Herminiimonas sp.]